MVSIRDTLENETMTTHPDFDTSYLHKTLIDLLQIPSPTGYTDTIVHHVGEELERIGLPFEVTRRGAIRVKLAGEASAPARAVVAHLDTIGAMVKSTKENGRLEVVPIGTWSSRFAEGARVSVFTESGSHRGTILPLKASGHAYNNEVDSQPVSWENLEIRIEEPVNNKQELKDLGIHPGDFVAVDPIPEAHDSGFIVSRHLDGKCGAAILLALAKSFVEHSLKPAVDCNLLFTITEEVGSGASAVLHGDVAEMVTLDMSPLAPNQSSSEYGATVILRDGSGPFDYHLTRKLLSIAKQHNIEHARDVLTYYFCDSASAIEAGNDIRTALVGYGVDASHGYERVHMRSIESVARLTQSYMMSAPAVKRDKKEMASMEGFPTQPE